MAAHVLSKAVSHHQSPSCRACLSIRLPQLPQAVGNPSASRLPSQPPTPSNFVPSIDSQTHRTVLVCKVPVSASFESAGSPVRTLPRSCLVPMLGIRLAGLPCTRQHNTLFLAPLPTPSLTFSTAMDTILLLSLTFFAFPPDPRKSLPNLHPPSICATSSTYSLLSSPLSSSTTTSTSTLFPQPTGPASVAGPLSTNF